MRVLELKQSFNIDELRQLRMRACHRRSLQRLEAIYLRAQGKTPPEIACILGCSSKTVRSWIKQFNAGGPEALQYRHTGGRRSKLNSEQEAALIHILQEGRPDNRRWTLNALVERLFEEYGIQLSKQQVFERVKRQGLSHFLLKSGRVKREMGCRLCPSQHGSAIKANES